jgi:hypothetical protein
VVNPKHELQLAEANLHVVENIISHTGTEQELSEKLTLGEKTALLNKYETLSQAWVQTKLAAFSPIEYGEQVWAISGEPVSYASKEAATKAYEAILQSHVKVW